MSLLPHPLKQSGFFCLFVCFRLCVACMYVCASLTCVGSGPGVSAYVHMYMSGPKGSMALPPYLLRCSLSTKSRVRNTSSLSS